MVIIVDCGSTKSDWLLLHGGRDQRLENTQGFNPFFQNTKDIIAILEGQLLHKITDPNAVESIYFYGTGIHDEHRAEIVAEALRHCFPKAEVEVKHDLLAAARATCGHDAGICCILGTGSNSCYYDGETIVDNVPSLGWLIGDEGSGTHLGKALLRAFFYRELPVDLERAFREAYPESPTAIKDRLFEQGANVYLASVSKFLGDPQHHPVGREVGDHWWSEFVERQVMKYKGYRQVPIHFVGSIAYHFEQILKKCLEQRGMRLGNIIRKPIFSLADYHLEGNSLEV